MTTSRCFFTIRRSLLLLAILIGFACGPGADEMGEFFSLFQPESATYSPADSHYIFTPQLYNTNLFGMAESADSASEETNTAAWVNYLGGGYSPASIGRALIDTSDNNTLMRQLTQAKPAAATYLTFAYSAQSLASDRNPWQNTKVDTTQLLQLAIDAHTRAGIATDPFLKERYAFQAVKLANEAGHYDRSRDYYQELVASLPRRTFISDWARCRFAGSLLSLEQNDQAIFEFAQVFAQCPTRRLAAERSLRQHGLRFTEAALNFAKTDAERVAVLAICAIQPRQDALPLLEKMVELDPKNSLIELVLAREINRNEYFFATKQFPGNFNYDAVQADSSAFDKRRQEAPDYAGRLLNFTENAAKNAALGNPAYYLTAAAYLQYLKGDYNTAKTTLDAATRQTTANQVLKQQIALQQMLVLAAQPGRPDGPTETLLLTYLTQFRQASAPDTASPYQTKFRFVNAVQTVGKQLANRYLTDETTTQSAGWLSGCSQKKAAEGDQATVAGSRQAKAFLMRLIAVGNTSTEGATYDFDGQMALEDSTSLRTTQNLAQYVANPTNEFDEQLVKLAGVDASYVNQLVGRRALAEENYQAAAGAFDAVKPEVWQSEAIQDYFAIDPFSVNMPGEGKPRNRYSPVQFAQRMNELLKQAVAGRNTAQGAQAWYALGCGAYNLTYYGNAWILQHRFRSADEPRTDPAPDPVLLDRFWHDPYYSASVAQAYFAQAAKQASDPELAAKATYMAARCEANALTTRRAVEMAKTGRYVLDDDTLFNARMRQLTAGNYDLFVKTYQARYRQTQFARQMETRCALYRDFMAGE